MSNEALRRLAYWALAVARGDLPEDSDPDDYDHDPDDDDPEEEAEDDV